MTEDKEREDYNGKGEGEPVIWYKQTIRNACGLIGLLHAVSNGAARGFVGKFGSIDRIMLKNCANLILLSPPEQGTDLDKLIKDAIPLPAGERADLLYNSQPLESAHQSAATQGQSSTPNAEDDIDLHYVCFVKDEKNNLWEMDGRRRGPLELGALGADEDVLSEKALNWGVRKFLKREEENGAELRFSLIALAPSLD